MPLVRTISHPAHHEFARSTQQPPPRTRPSPHTKALSMQQGSPPKWHSRRLDVSHTFLALLTHCAPSLLFRLAHSPAAHFLKALPSCSLSSHRPPTTAFLTSVSIPTPSA